MRHKYATTALVLARVPIGEANVLLTLLTHDVGLVRVRAQGIRKPGAKLAPALQTLAESEVILVRGKEWWRLSGAVLERAWFGELSRLARMRAGRTAGLLLRLVHDDISDGTFFTLFICFLTALAELERTQDPGILDALQDAAECLVVLRLIQILGLDAGDIPGGAQGDFSVQILQEVIHTRSDIILRINHGIAASGL